MVLGKKTTRAGHLVRMGFVATFQVIPASSLTGNSARTTFLMVCQCLGSVPGSVKPERKGNVSHRCLNLQNVIKLETLVKVQELSLI